MRKVLVLIKGLGPGGAEQLIVDGLSHADTTRFEYRVAYVVPYKSHLVPRLRAQGLTVDCLGGTARGWPWQLRRLLHSARPDIVHAHLPITGVAARVLASGGDAMSVYTEHNVWQSYRKATFALNAVTFSQIDHVFAVSDEVRTSIVYPPLLSRLPLPPIETLYHGIDVARVRAAASVDGVRAEFGIANDAPLVVTVANFRPNKGFPTLLRAAVLARNSLPDIRFLIVGQGQLEASIRADVARLGLAETVVFAGFRQDVPRIVGSADVFALASDFEGFPIALLEAMATGRPSVATSVGGVPEALRHGREGVLVPPRDPQGFAEEVVRLFGDEEGRRSMGEAARVRAEEFGIGRAIARIEAVYGELTAA